MKNIVHVKRGIFRVTENGVNSNYFGHPELPESFEKPLQYREKGIYIEDRALSLLADATKQERDH